MTTDAQMPELDPLIVGIAQIIDHPSVYMGGPSRNSMRIATEIVKCHRADLCASGQVRALTRAAGDESKAGWTISFDDLQAIRAAAGDWGYSLDLEAVEAIVLEVERRILAALTPAQQPAGEAVSVAEATAKVNRLRIDEDTPAEKDPGFNAGLDAALRALKGGE